MAAKFQQYECARALLVYGANHSIANVEYQETALHLAAKTGATDILQLLIDYGADVNAKISKEYIPGGTPLLYAALYDTYDFDSVKILLENGADAKQVNSYGETALHVSVRNQNIRVVQLLVDRYDADVDATDTEGCTPLSIFARDNAAQAQLEVPEFLIDRGADMEATCRKSERTPLHYAVATLNVPLVALLLNKGANIEAVDYRGVTPLYIAVADADDHTSHRSTENTRVTVIKMLLQHGANPNASVKHNRTIVALNMDGDDNVVPTKMRKCLTVMNGFAKKGSQYHFKEISRLLVAYGGELNASKTLCPQADPIYIARENGNQELSDFMWRLLIDRKQALGPMEDLFNADDYESVYDIPGLITAIARNDMGQVAKFVIEPLTMTFSQNKSDKSKASLQKSKINHLVKIEDHNGQTALHVAAKWRSLSVARVLLHLGANVNAVDKNGNTPLHFAAKNGYKFMVELLLQHGAKLDAIASGGTPLTYSVTHSNSPETVHYLLEYGADVTGRNAKPSLLHLASTRQNIRMMSLLLKFGANIEAKTDDKLLTPLGLLMESDCCYPQLPVVSFLLDHGANVDSRDVNERTPLNAAIALKKRKEIVSFLLTRGADPNAKNLNGCYAPLYRLITVVDRRVHRYYRHSMTDDMTEVGEIAKELIRRGADIDYIDKCTLETAKQAAVYLGDEHIIDVLDEASRKIAKFDDKPPQNDELPAPLKPPLNDDYYGAGLISFHDNDFDRQNIDTPPIPPSSSLLNPQ